jgi:hypothetical protein
MVKKAGGSLRSPPRRPSPRYRRPCSASRALVRLTMPDSRRILNCLRDIDMRSPPIRCCGARLEGNGRRRTSTCAARSRTTRQRRFIRFASLAGRPSVVPRRGGIPAEIEMPAERVESLTEHQPYGRKVPLHVLATCRPGNRDCNAPGALTVVRRAMETERPADKAPSTVGRRARPPLEEVESPKRWRAHLTALTSSR